MQRSFDVNTWLLRKSKPLYIRSSRPQRATQARDADQHPAGDDEQRAEPTRLPTPFALAQKTAPRGRRPTATRSRRAARRPDPPVEVRLEEADVGEPEEQPGRQHAGAARPRSARAACRAPRRACLRASSPPPPRADSRAHAARARCCRGRRRDGRTGREPERDASAGARAGRARSRARSRRPRSRRLRSASGTRTGSPRKTSAMPTATSGPAPTVTEVRDAPASRTDRVNRICEQPGASRPASRNGHAPCRWWCGQRGDERARDGRRDRASRAPRRRRSPPRRPKRIATVIAPKSAAEASASRRRSCRPSGAPHECPTSACRRRARRARSRP